jgi:hypothetical protein
VVFQAPTRLHTLVAKRLPSPPRSVKSHDSFRPGRSGGHTARSQVVPLGDRPLTGFGDSPLRPCQRIVISAQLHHGFGDLDDLVRRRQVAAEQRDDFVDVPVEHRQALVGILRANGCSPVLRRRSISLRYTASPDSPNAGTYRFGSRTKKS